MKNVGTAHRSVIIAGGFRLPDGNASAIRAMGLAKLLTRVGYEVLVLGKFQEIPADEVQTHATLFNGIEMRDIRKPYADTPLCNYEVSAKSIEAVIDRFAQGKAAMALLYNYPSRGILAAQRVCAAHNTPLSLDLTEWRVWEGSKFLRNLIWLADSEIRMRVLSRLVGNVLCTSTHMAELLRVRNTLVLPFAVDPTEQRWSEFRKASVVAKGPRRFIYSGSPGLGMFKDKLPVILSSFCLMQQEGWDFELDLFGLTAALCITNAPDTRPNIQALGSRVRFHGRVDHGVAVTSLSRAHYAVFFREPSRYSDVGFPTKFMEAVTLGVPVITNPTSDITNYLRNGENGFLSKSHNLEDVCVALRAALTINDDAYKRMRQKQAESNPFSLSQWEAEIQTFMDRLQ